MVLLLARVLDVPLRDRNDLLSAAGYAPMYRATPHDITLQDLRIESFFPADAATEDAARRLAAR